MQKAGLFVALVLLPIPLSVFALAAENDLAAQPIQEMTVTAFRVPQPATKLPLSLAQLDSKTLENTAHLHIQESLNRLPGVNFHRNSGQEYLAAIRSPVFTGPGSCGSVLSAEEGLPLRPVGFCNVNELFEAHTEAAAAIEVLRGPGTAVFGSNAMHGVINLRDLTSNPNSLRASIDAGAYGFRRLKLAAANGQLSGALTLGSTDGYRTDSGYHQQKLSLNHRTKSGNTQIKTSLTATHLDQQTAGFLTGTNAYKNKKLARTNPNPEAFRKATALRLSTLLENPDSGWQLRPFARFSSMRFLQHFLPGQPHEENGHYSLGIMSGWTSSPVENMQIILGLDLEYADIWLKQFQDNLTQGSPFLQATIPPGQHYNYRVHSTVAGPYAHLDWQPTDKWQLGLGTRLERVEYRYRNHLPSGRTRADGTPCGFSGCRYSRPADSQDIFTNFSPKLSAQYAWSKNLSTYMNISNGFRAPQTTELYRLQRDQVIADLQSEELNSIELGSRYIKENLILEAALFRMKKKNVILRDANFFTVSAGKTEHQGLELQGQWTFATDWSLEAAATYARHRYRNNPGLSRNKIIGNDIDTAPRYFASTRLIRQLGQSRAELEWQHMGRYYTDPENQHSYPGHNLLHLRTSWQWHKNWTASLRLNNLLNQHYAERADFSPFTGNRYLPGQPRRLHLGVAYRL